MGLLSKKKQKEKFNFLDVKIQPASIGQAMHYLGKGLLDSKGVERHYFYYNPEENLLRLSGEGIIVPKNAITLTYANRKLGVDDLGRMVNSIHSESKGFYELKNALAEVGEDKLSMHVEFAKIQDVLSHKPDLDITDRIHASIESSKYDNSRAAVSIRANALGAVYEYDTRFSCFERGIKEDTVRQCKSSDTSGGLLRTIYEEFGLDRTLEHHNSFVIMKIRGPEGLKQTFDTLLLAELAINQYASNNGKQVQQKTKEAIEQAKAYLPK